MSEVFFLTWIQCNFGWTHLILIFLYYLKPCLQNQLLFSNNETVCHDAVSSSLHTEANTESPPPDSFFLFIFYSAFQKWLSDFWKHSFLHHLYPVFKFTNSSFSYFWSYAYPVPLEFQIIRSKCPEKSEWPEHLHLTNFKLLLCKVT